VECYLENEEKNLPDIICSKSPPRGIENSHVIYYGGYCVGLMVIHPELIIKENFHEIKLNLNPGQLADNQESNSQIWGL